MIRYKPKRHQPGFTLVEMVVSIVVVIVLLAVLIWPTLTTVRERAQRVNCQANLNQMWKAISGWELSSGDSFRPGNDETKGCDAFKELLPAVFICPEAGRLCKINPDTNCYYQYYSGRRDRGGDNVLICDMHGPNRIAGPTAWGGNHGGQGGNIVKMAGSGQWLESRNYPGKLCITNPEIARSFTTNGIVVLYLKE